MTAPRYVRPQWTGKPLHYSDGKPSEGMAQCPSCLSHHADTYNGCNGKRVDSLFRCCVWLPTSKVQCDRPDGHLGPHQAVAHGLDVEWGPSRWPATPPQEAPGAP